MASPLPWLTSAVVTKFPFKSRSYHSSRSSELPNIESHRKFTDQYNLGFPLIADTNGVITKTYDVKMPRMDMDNRVSFLISTDGKLSTSPMR